MSYINKNLFFFTSLFLKQANFLKARDVTIQSKMFNGSQLIFEKFGDPLKVLHFKDITLPSPGPSEVLIKMILAPINPADINTIQGVYPVKPPFPAVPGNEGVGVVEKVGPDVKDLCPGDKIIPNFEALGTWRTHMIAKTNQVLKVPDGIDLVKLAGITSNPSTAYRMLKDFVDLKPGDTIIQNGANSAAGQNVIQLCKIWGINSINIVRNRPGYENLKKYLLDLGATRVHTTDECRHLTIVDIPKPILALNCVGGLILRDTTLHLDSNGTIVTYGGMSREPITVSTSTLIFKNFKYSGFWMTRWYRQNRGNEKHLQMLNDLLSYMKSDQLNAPNHQFIPLNDYRVPLSSALKKDGNREAKYYFDMR